MWYLGNIDFGLRGVVLGCLEVPHATKNKLTTDFATERRSVRRTFVVPNFVALTSSHCCWHGGRCAAHDVKKNTCGVSQRAQAIHQRSSPHNIKFGNRSIVQNEWSVFWNWMKRKNQNQKESIYLGISYSNSLGMESERERESWWSHDHEGRTKKQRKKPRGISPTNETYDFSFWCFWSFVGC